MEEVDRAIRMGGGVDDANEVIVEDEGDVTAAMVEATCG
jgi:hypothetical protein